MSNIQLANLIIDFGLVVLIWMVQLLIYPSFKHYSKSNLIAWHNKYTLQMALVVIPLMFGQLLIYCYLVFDNPSLLISLRFGLVILMWIITFLIFVPLHTKISKGEHDQQTLHQLCNKNWSRTIVWSMIFMLNILNFV